MLEPGAGQRRPYMKWSHAGASLQCAGRFISCRGAAGLRPATRNEVAVRVGVPLACAQ
ncbi:MAG: hypothetical protein ABI456_02615 [Ktedonobacteraceae bacterium]